MGMRNMARKRGPTPVVVIATTLPTAPTSMEHAMWIERSWERELWYDTPRAASKVANQTGTVKSRVSVSPEPSD